jgi:2,4-dienoyl-CoA reductase-like NADH-dependent reductase (Old Yellow Enzyme family)
VKLLEAIDINGMRLPNRIVVPAMVTRLSGEDGLVNADISDRYLRFARGEPGLIVVEAMSVHGGKSGPLLRISDDSYVAGHAGMIQAMHDVSPSKVAAQIIHFLKIARSGWRQKIGDLSLDDIRTIIRQYAAAAGRVRRAGYDAVELHMAHAYTQSSFLSLHNRRTDAYGRSLENRMRMMTETIRAVRSEVGADFPLGIRFDGEECIKDGYTLSDSREMALRMAMLGADWISISAGGKFEDAVHKPGEPLYPYTGYSGDRCMPSTNYPDGANIYLAEGIKAYLNARGFGTPVVATGKIRTPELAESILTEGRADLIGMARALLADPDWPLKVRQGAADRIVRCVLWPKGSLQAPQVADDRPPEWTYGEPGLVATENNGRVQLKWNHATDDVAVYGYEILRSADGGPFDHINSVKGVFYVDDDVVGGVAYRYRVRAYDLAGNRTPASNTAELVLPDPTAATVP